MICKTIEVRLHWMAQTDYKRMCMVMLRSAVSACNSIMTVRTRKATVRIDNNPSYSTLIFGMLYICKARRI